MKVICVESTAKNLDLTEVTTIFLHQYDYQLIVGREYLVMGMVIYKDTNCLYYLIDNDANPRWYPYMLFKITNNKLSAEWYTRVIGQHHAGEIHTLVGFYELCHNENFHDALLEREEYALQTYFKRKEEIFYDYFG